LIAHLHVVIAAKETIKTELFGVLSDGEKVFVEGALLGFSEDAKFHTSTITSS
jgi:hypothetical protein